MYVVRSARTMSTIHLPPWVSFHILKWVQIFLSSTASRLRFAKSSDPFADGTELLFFVDHVAFGIDDAMVVGSPAFGAVTGGNMTAFAIGKVEPIPPISMKYVIFAALIVGVLFRHNPSFGDLGVSGRLERPDHDRLHPIMSFDWDGTSNGRSH